mmetsp:Transcript_13626/g.59445  ORF Transcript_13626/g.59445 Transcript_13626/m.59445 type:complete len:340 (-) Transcript_13626:2146-3165(-)
MSDSSSDVHVAIERAINHAGNRNTSSISGWIISQQDYVYQTSRTELPVQLFSVTKSLLSLVIGIFAHDRPVTSLNILENYNLYQFLTMTSGFQTKSSAFNAGDCGNTSRSAKTRYRPYDPIGKHVGEERRAFEYSDKAADALACFMTDKFDEDISVVFRKHIARPLDLSTTWRWKSTMCEKNNGEIFTFTPERSCGTLLNKQKIKSVVSGSIGMEMSSRDLLKIGQLLLHRGFWGGRSIISYHYLQNATTTQVNVDYGGTDIGYGFLLWINHEKKLWPSLPERSYAMLGYCDNICLVVEEWDLVLVHTSRPEKCIFDPFLPHLQVLFDLLAKTWMNNTL